MNYTKIYNSIIEKRKTHPLFGVYTETHHIIPKSIGGSDNPENLVNLSAREHFICHRLLIEIHKNHKQNYYKMVKAFFMMLVTNEKQERFVTSRKYKQLREKFSKIQSESQSGSLNSNFGKMWCVDKNGNNRRPFYLNEIPEGWQSSYEFKKKQREEKRSIEISDRRNKEISEKQTYHRTLHKIYLVSGYEGVVKQTGYKYSKQNLVQNFQRLLPEFVPQNGKRRVSNSQGNHHV
jgi:hypothetical protein